jgi:hypothetical protein
MVTDMTWRLPQIEHNLFYSITADTPTTVEASASEAAANQPVANRCLWQQTLSME